MALWHDIGRALLDNGGLEPGVESDDWELSAKGEARVFSGIGPAYFGDG